MTYEPVYTRRPSNAFVPSPIFLGIIVIFIGSGYMAWTGIGKAGVDVFLFVVAGWLLSLCLHEYGHAVVGYFSGDRSVADKGYLRLNPLKYTSPVLSIILPVVAVILGGIGLPGGAVWVDHSVIRSKGQESLISLAGPATNLVLAVVCAVPFWLGGGKDIGFTGSELTGPHADFWVALAAIGFLQVTASILNFIPVPGLDGGNIIQPWLNDAYKKVYTQFAPWCSSMPRPSVQRAPAASVSSRNFTLPAP